MKITGKMPNSTAGTESTKSTKAAGLDALDGGKTKASKNVLEDMGNSSRVEVSSRAQDMAKAKELATPGDSVDEAKVARLQKLIDSGTYKVDADAVADRMVDEFSKMPS